MLSRFLTFTHRKPLPRFLFSKHLSTTLKAQDCLVSEEHLEYYNEKYEGKTGGQIIHEKLIEHKIKDVFMYSGGAVMPLIDAFYKCPNISYYIPAHEQSLGHAATGYAKASGKIGVCIVTSGPGLTNMVTPMLDATNDSTPLLVFSGQVPLSAMGSNAFQECDATAITQSVTKWNYCLESTEEIPYIIDYALLQATTGKPGSVHIDVPKCISASKYNVINAKKHFYDNYKKLEKYNEIKKKFDNLYKCNGNNDNITHNIKNLQNHRNKEIFKKIANIINNAKKPIFYIGQGCVNASDLLTKAAIKNNIPVTTTLHGMGIFDETHQLSLQMCGMHGNYAANHALQNADVIIAIGARFDDRTTGAINTYAPNARNLNGCIIHVNIEENEFNKVLPTNYNFLMDSKEFLHELLPFLEKKTNDEWIEKINDWKFDYSHQFRYPKDGLLNQQIVISELNNVIKQLHINDNKRTLVTTGVGNHQMYTTQFIEWYKPNKMLSSGSLGVMGCSNGYAMGAQISDKNAIVLSIDGDGSFNMTSSELMTMKRYNLPIKIALMNDGNLSMVRVWEKLFFQNRITATQLGSNPNYVKLADAYGFTSFSCDNINDLQKCVKKLMYTDGPVLCEFKVLTDECYPLVAPGKALDDMILLDTDQETTMKKMEGALAPS